MTPKNRDASDPFADREAANYENPIPSREFILKHLEQRNVALSHSQLAAELKLDSEQDIEALRRRLNAMTRDGQLTQSRSGEFKPIDHASLLRGRVQGHREGYGFFIPDSGGEDLFLNNREMYRVFDGDRVLVRPSGFQQRGKEEAVIVEVLERAHTQVVGRLAHDGDLAYVQPENQRISQDVLIAQDAEQNVAPGQMVVVKILQYPDKRKHAVGRVIEVLGEHMAPGMEIDVALRSYNIPFEWPEEVDFQLQKMPGHVEGKETEKRIDLRNMAFVTIDGEDARDFDDAVYAESLTGGGWKLWVAIADVSHYVRVDSALDREAYQRGTSVYFPEQVVPMLPELLSNDLCSLNPAVDRLTMACEMNISPDGELLDYRFCEAVIHSHARLTYNKVYRMLVTGDTPEGGRLRQEYQQVVPHLETLYTLYEALRQARGARGAIDFDSVELRIEFGENRKIERIVPVERNDAHKLIEECMLCANVAAADFLKTHELPGLYRVHGKPSIEKLEGLREFLDTLGLRLGGGLMPRAQDYRELLDQVKDRPDAHLIQTVMLRSMLQAEYSPDNEGHFGLAYEAYAHFTSPIRRYPDLLVHRAIRSVIRSRRKSGYVRRTPETRPLVKKNIYPYTHDQMVELGEHCSQAERRADDAVRDVQDWLKCEYMQDRVGELYEGVITGVTAFGLFIELREIYIEGLLHVSALRNDYYHYDGVSHCLQGERSGVTYQLGDLVEVVVSRVSLDERKIDFDLAEAAGDEKPRKKLARHKQGKKTSGKPKGETGKAKDKQKAAKKGSKGKKTGKRRD